MSIKPTLLITDWLILGLLLALIIFIFIVRKHPHLREPWQRVFQRKLSMIAFVVLSFYATIGLLDSIHLQISTINPITHHVNVKQRTVFDLLIGELGERDEKTYSKPLATHAHQRAWVVLPNGQEVYTYPKLQHPGKHIFGTNQIGEDVFYQTIKSIRTGLLIGTLTTLIMLPFALLFGMMAGYFSGIIDDIIQYLYTTLSSIPGVLLISAMVLVMQVTIANHPQLFPTIADRADARLLALCFILGITSWASLCRLLRAETLKLREQDFVTASITMGARSFWIIVRHVLPNVMHIVLITVVLDFSGLVLAESILSYVGVGVDPTTSSWGNMINTARLELAREPMVWWPLLAALVVMFFFVLSANIFADAVRDAFDPRLRNSRR